jgi:SAM-dependent methyltransferase
MRTLDELVTDEVEFMRSVLPLAGADVVELGCGKAEVARKLVERGLVNRVTAMEVDQVQHQLNCAGPVLPGLEFRTGGADDIPLPDARYHIAVMLKSLHHVPVARMDHALAEIQRVLMPGGYLYVSEPVYAGPFNDIIRLFHDEGAVRAAAYAALEKVIATGDLLDAGETAFDMPLDFKDFDDFFNKIVRVTHSELVLAGETLVEVRRQFARHMTGEGARFVRPMRVNVLRKPE